VGIGFAIIIPVLCREACRQNRSSGNATGCFPNLVSLSKKLKHSKLLPQVNRTAHPERSTSKPNLNLI
jgi:hypothetical protein